MKILHIVSGMDPSSGGVTQAVRTIIKGLSDSGETNEVVCLDNAGEAFLSRNEFRIYPLGPSKTAWRYSNSLAPWLKRNLQAYDVVIVHGLWQYHSYAVMQALKKMKSAKPRLFVMPHGMLDPYFQKARDRRLKAARNWVFWKLVERHIINKADCLLFTCEMEKVLAAQSFTPYHPKKEEVVGLGLALPPAFTAEMEKAFIEKCGGIDTRGCWLFISRIHAKKGLDLLIKAYTRLQQQDDSVPKLVIAGPGLESSFGMGLKQMTAENENIIFTGMLEGESRWGAFYSCSAMILPSHQENFGFVVVEAMACNKPVLISNQVNIWREIAAGNGGLVEDDTEEGTLRLLQKWQKMVPAERAAMKEMARSIFEKNFSLSGAASRLLTALSKSGQ